MYIFFFLHTYIYIYFLQWAFPRMIQKIRPFEWTAIPMVQWRSPMVEEPPLCYDMITITIWMVT